MKARHASVLVSLTTIGASAQVVFDLPLAIPPFGTEQYEWWYADPTVITTTGQSVVWDFSSTITPLPGLTHQSLIAPASSTPWAGYFPSATHAYGDITNGADTTWLYYQLGGDSLVQWGDLWSGLPSAYTSCTDPAVRATFPFSYEQLVEGTATCTEAGDPPTTELQGSEVVATGTVLTPIGTINDVALVRYHFNGAPVNFFQFFRTNNILAPFGQYGDASLTLWIPASVGMEETHGGRVLTVHPLPASEVVFVEVANNSSVPFEVMDVMGSVVQRGSSAATGGSLRIDVATWPAGQYVLRLFDNGSPAYARISVAR